MSTHNLWFEQKYEKKNQIFLSEIFFFFLVVKYSIYLNRRVSIMCLKTRCSHTSRLDV